MADLRSYSREIILEIIHCFREHECLWMFTSRDYKNKVLKSAAYEKLREILIKQDPRCTVTDVKNLIQSVRASHRRERKTVQASMKTGSGADDVYTPKLWYYTEMEFLNDHLDSSSVSTLHETGSQLEDTGDESTMTMTPETEMAPSPSQSSTSTRKRKQPITEQGKRQELMEKISNKLENTEDEFDVVGKNIANKLRVMNGEQRIHAEKIINDALYYGTLNYLSFDSCINRTTSNQMEYYKSSSGRNYYTNSNHTPMNNNFTNTLIPNISDTLTLQGQKTVMPNMSQSETLTLHGQNGLHNTVNVYPTTSTPLLQTAQNYLQNFTPN